MALLLSWKAELRWASLCLHAVIASLDSREGETVKNLHLSLICHNLLCSLTKIIYIPPTCKIHSALLKALSHYSINSKSKVLFSKSVLCAEFSWDEFLTLHFEDLWMKTTSDFAFHTPTIQWWERPRNSFSGTGKMASTWLSSVHRDPDIQTRVALSAWFLCTKRGCPQGLSSSEQFLQSELVVLRQVEFLNNFVSFIWMLLTSWFLFCFEAGSSLPCLWGCCDSAVNSLETFASNRSAL